MTFLAPTRERYRAVGAQQRTDEESKRPRRSLLIADPVLACLVRANLDEGFSPAGCAARLRRSGAGAICHETIYRSVFDGSLGLKPSECLRTRRPRRRRRRSKAQTTHVLGTFTKIADRPTTVEDRVEAGQAYSAHTSQVLTKPGTPSPPSLCVRQPAPRPSAWRFEKRVW
jgi:IS30 family transposase